jgi:hypothetical protein
VNVISASIEDIRERMGAESTTDDAKEMRAILLRTGVVDTDELTDREWFALAATVSQGEGGTR